MLALSRPHSDISFIKFLPDEKVKITVRPLRLVILVLTDLRSYQDNYARKRRSNAAYTCQTLMFEIKATWNKGYLE